MEELEDTMSLDEFLIENEEATFLVRVRGDSTKEEGILSGDIIIVERGRGPKKNDLVIAEISGEYVLKRYGNLKNGEESRVEAVVMGVVRKYK